MKRIICMSAIAGTGKSAWAKCYLKNHKDENVFIVASDEIRLELYGRYDDLEHEDVIWKTYYERINKIRDENEDCTIIADSTNIVNEFRQKVAKIPGFHERILVLLTKDINQILVNNRERDPAKFVPENVILSMYKRWENLDSETFSMYNKIIHVDGWYDKTKI